MIQESLVSAVYDKGLLKEGSVSEGSFTYNGTIPQSFNLEDGKSIDLQCSIEDITEEFFKTDAAFSSSQQKFLRKLKQPFLRIIQSQVHSSTQDELNMYGYMGDLEENASNAAVLDALGDVSSANDEVDSTVNEAIAEWFTAIPEQSKRAHRKKITIPDLALTYETIVIGNVKVDENVWIPDEQIINMLLFVKKKLGFPLPSDFQLYVIATLESQEFMSIGLTSSLTKLLDMGGMKIGDSALIFEYGYHSPNHKVLGEEKNLSATHIDSYSSAVITKHEVAHLCDQEYFGSTEPQAEAFAVSMQLGLDLTKSLQNLKSYEENGKTNQITADLIRLLFSSEPPHYLKVWHIYGLAPAFYCFVYERVGIERFKAFYETLTSNNGGEQNLLRALKSIAAENLPDDFVSTVSPEV